MKSLFTTIIMLGCFSAFSQVGFQKKYNFNTVDGGESLLQTPDGGYVLVGSAPALTPLNAGMDYYITKTDSLGQTQWSWSLGTNNNDYCSAVALSSDKGYMLAGGSDGLYLVKLDSTGALDWTLQYMAPSILIFSMQRTADNGYIIGGALDYDMYAIKVDSAGNKQWDLTFASSLEGLAIRQTADSGYIFVGYTSDFPAGYRIFLTRLNKNGTRKWTKIYGAASPLAPYEWGRNVRQTKDGGFIVVGWTEMFGAGQYDMCLLKTDSLGNKLWSRTYGGPLREDGYDVREMPNGDFVALGYTNSFGAGGSDIYLVRTDSVGHPKWSRCYGSTASEQAFTLITTSDGGFAMAGDGYMVKTDSLGVSGCNETANVPTITDTTIFSTLTPALNVTTNIATLHFLNTYGVPGLSLTDVCNGHLHVSSEGQQAFLLYPNPSSGRVHIHSSCSNYLVSIINPQGATVFTRSFQQSEADIDLSQLAIGIYFYQVYQGSLVVAHGKLFIK